MVRIILLSLIYIGAALHNIQAQGGGVSNNGKFPNDWIDYKKNYLRIHVTKTGIQKLSVQDLPASWQSTSPDQWQLWHRGKEISIIKASNSEIVFYGETNDGSSDSAVFVPSTARLNPYQSLFSDVGVYFLTTAASPKRASNTSLPFSASNETLKYHLRKDTVVYNVQFSNRTWETTDLNQSYYDESNSWTGPTIIGPEAWTAVDLPRELILNFSLANRSKASDSPKPQVEMLFHALYNGAHDIRVESGAGKLFAKTAFSGYGGSKVRFELLDNDLSSDDKGSFRIHSVSQSNADWFSISYYSIVYPQQITMGGQKQKLFQFPKATSSAPQSLVIENAPASLSLYDITDPYDVKVIQGGSLQANQFRATVARNAGRETQILATQENAVQNIAKGNISEVNFAPLFLYDQNTITGALKVDPEKYDYLIITNQTLRGGAIEYAKYRASSEGGNYRTLVINIRDVYDQFNYGEPSPIAIRNFVGYMLSKGIRENKHYLFLFGPGVTAPNALRKEMVDEVPSFGDPGSDHLLVAGLAGVLPDLQAIPVGRIKAFNDTEVLNYLKKVRDYEHEKNDISWRKKFLHMSGGHSVSEINTLQGILQALEPVVKNGPVAGEVKKVVKTITEVEKVDISKEVNEGVGMITFFGHGSQRVTDLDFGFASDASRGFNNNKKYPLMYFNGCGVGNIFAGRSTHILSDDWLLTPDKGSVAIIANSYLSYVSPSAKHITQLYKAFFESGEKRSVGYILKAANQAVLSDNPTSYDKANAHQVVLQGDPAIHLIVSDLPDYIIDSEEGITLYSKDKTTTIGNSDEVNLALTIKNGGRYLAVGKNIPVELTISYRNGTTTTRNLEIAGVRNTDTLWVKIEKDYQIDRIQARINPDKQLEEFSFTNNSSELIINWDEIESLTYYPSVPLRDVISPTVVANFKGRPAKSGATLSSLADIEITVFDDRSLTQDEATVTIFLKPCWDNTCEYEQLTDVSLEALDQDGDNRRLVLKLTGSSLLPPGQYEILVQASDRAGNNSTTPYSIQFEVVGEFSEEVVRVTVSPNPMNSFAKFTLDKINLRETASAVLEIYSLTGALIDRKNFDGSGIPGEFYWTPSASLTSGIYLYKLIITDVQNKTRVVQGKVVKQ